MNRFYRIGLALSVCFLFGCAGSAKTPPGGLTLEEYRDDYDARRMLLMGDIARRFEDYDLSTQLYQKVIDRFPDTRWASEAKAAIAQSKADAVQHLTLWDTKIGGSPEGEQSRRMLLAGNVAYQHGDALTALKFYERSYTISPDSLYGKQSASKIRWIRRWRNPGP